MNRENKSILILLYFQSPSFCSLLLKEWGYICPLPILVTKRELKQYFDQRKIFLCVQVQVIMYVCSQPSGGLTVFPVTTKESGPLRSTHSTKSNVVLALHKQLQKHFLGIFVLRGHTWIRWPMLTLSFNIPKAYRSLQSLNFIPVPEAGLDALLRNRFQSSWAGKRPESEAHTTWDDELHIK